MAGFGEHHANAAVIQQACAALVNLAGTNIPPLSLDKQEETQSRCPCLIPPSQIQLSSSVQFQVLWCCPVGDNETEAIDEGTFPGIWERMQQA